MTDTKREIEKLIERLEKATGPDRRIDGQIWLLDNRIPNQDSLTVRQTASYLENISDRYTGSLDAALTLVPERCAWRVGKNLYGDCEASIQRYGSEENGKTFDIWEDCTGNTAAIALCIAALRRVENIELAIEGRDNKWSSVRALVNQSSVNERESLLAHNKALEADVRRKDEALVEAGKRVLAGLKARIEAAPSSSIPVFDGIADLHDEINKFERVRKS